MSRSKNVFIQHRFNLGEKRLTYRNLPVDGFIEARKEILQVHSCFYHGHECRLNRDSSGKLKKWNESNQKKMEDLRKNTQEITQYLEAAGYRMQSSESVSGTV